MNVKIEGRRKIRAKVTIPPDKSISHRSIMIGSLARGTTEIENFLFAEDCLSTINCFKKLGAEIEIKNDKVIVKGKNYSLSAPQQVLDCGNSGTTTRLLLGILSTQEFEAVLDGDSSLRKRPMKRVTQPLGQMGACFEFLEKEDCLPIKVKGKKNLKPIDYTLPVSSAQVKSALIFAALKAEGKSVIKELPMSRDHTELMLKSAGADIATCFENGFYKIEVMPSNLEALKIKVPSDISSAAFFIVLALICEDSEVIIENCILNPTRTGIIDILKQMGADIKIKNVQIQNGETIGTIVAKTSSLRGATVDKNDIPRIIDEIPILAVAAAFADGKTIIDNASELRVKESDRIKTTLEMLKNFGAECYELENGLEIVGSRDNLKAGVVNSYNDHRIAMAASILACAVDGESTITNAECVSISFPNFYKILLGHSKKV
ncbi:3-phosphoshikimate 1-carboxyvinyltransferase [Caldicellulosiruptor changbaiensis]|uniref:3-phosphoshikimate 1-carboxyvinyltransferase n=1 Tax=Caldicellulosiruptor changbaiensis TaxID=1222016 RepID=A0A3T0D4E0_9FIRM|nr:3-phosphoshikimate 1-carboxyvinyltransferase [Caldicellulosiruptor changbaiensis]AZT89908.1 3-phosphoshikimate 1-carboxyvinyltransferase [Caldicellulosiruptor changbaiensis]